MPPAPPVSGPTSPAALAEAVKRRWLAGDDPDAAAALRDHPELLGYQSVVVDLAYEEFCRREEAGAAPDADAFAARFPVFRSGIREVVRAHAWLADHPGLAPAEPHWPQPGDTIEGYEVVGEVARGAFARVYLAADPQVGRHVVLKVAPGGSAEARAMAQVRHPHVIDVYWAKPVGDLFVLCMPFAAVATLQDVCDTAFPGPAATPPAGADAILAAVGRAEAAYAGLVPAAGEPVLTGGERYADGVAAVALRVAEALAALHRAGVVHADLKPSNVLMAAGGYPYLIDFNLAVGPDADLRRCGGTLPYMPPEQLRRLTGAPAEVSPRADVYAFGVLVYQLATGRLPFDPGPSADPRAAADHLLAQHRAGLDPRATATLPLPRPLAELVGRCLATDPADRPADAGELVRALRRPGPRPSLWWRLTAATVAAAMVAGLSAWAFADRAEIGPRPQSTESAGDPFDRGRDHLDGCVAGQEVDEGKVRVALAYFYDANKRRGDGRTAAHISYCLGLLGQSQAAADQAATAIQLGYGTPAVHNNRAHSLLAVAQKQNAAEAVTHLTAALGADPGLRAARYNLARALFWRDLDQDRWQLTALDSVAHMDEVLRAGPTTGRLYLDAAQIYAVASRQRPELLSRALDCVREALRRGKTPRQLRQDMVLNRVIGNDPAFGVVLGGPAPAPAPADPPPPPISLQLVDPGRE